MLNAKGETVTKGDFQQVRADLQHFATKADIYRVILLQTAVILGSTFTMLRLLG